MTDVFISYKKEDAARVEPIARALARAGYEVWWDHNIPPGRSYREVIGAALASAKCVIVVWSKLSADAQWVLDEADTGKQRKVLLPLMIDDVEIPYGFRQIEAARLVGWAGDEHDHEWTNAVAAVAHFVGRPPGGAPKPFAAPAARSVAAAQVPDKKRGGAAGPLIGGVVLAGLLAGAAYYAWDEGLIGGGDPSETAELTAPDSAVPIDGAEATPVDDAETPANPQAAAGEAVAAKTTKGLQRVGFEGGGAVVREALGVWVEENAKTGALDGYRWREESRDADTITLRDDGREARMRIELTDGAIYLYFPDWGKWEKQWNIGETRYDG